MARGRAKIELTLFPFLSVLAGLIAVMMLFMMVTLGTRVIGEESEGASAASAAAAQTALDHNGSLESEGIDDGIDEARWRQLHTEVNRLNAELAKRARDHNELMRTVEQLETLIEVKKNEMQLAATLQPRPGKVLGEPTPVQVVPVRDPGVTIAKKPVYIEISAAGYVLHPEKQTFPPVKKQGTGAAATFVVDPALVKLLADVNKRRNERYLVYLIHPSGVQAWNNLDGYVFRTYRDQLSVGWEPFSRDWMYVPQAKKLP